MAFRSSLMVIGLLMGASSAKYFVHHSSKPLSSDELAQLERPMHHHHHQDSFNLQTEADNMMESRSRVHSRSHHRQAQRVSADELDYTTATDDKAKDEDTLELEEMKKEQQEFIKRNQAFQKETVSKIEKNQAEAEQVIQKTRAKQRTEFEALSKAEKMDQEIDDKHKENSINDLYKSIVHQDTNEMKELETKILGKKPTEAPKTTTPTKNLAQQQTAGLLRGMNKMMTQAQQKQLTISNKQQEHEMQQQIQEEYRHDPIMQADILHWDTGVTYDDNLQMLDDQEANADDLDEDSFREPSSYDEQADVLKDQDFQMNLDDI